MRKVTVLLLALLTMAVFAGTASAKARSIIVWSPEAVVTGHGVAAWGMPAPSQY